MCVILLKMLPPDTPATIGTALEECTDFDALNKNLKKHIDWFVDHPVSGNPRVQRVDGQAPVEQQQEVPPPPPSVEEEVVDLSALEPEQQLHTLALMRQNGFRGTVRTNTGAQHT